MQEFSLLTAHNLSFSFKIYGCLSYIIEAIISLFCMFSVLLFILCETLNFDGLIILLLQFTKKVNLIYLYVYKQ